MPLNFVSSGGGSPFIRYSVEDNEWTRSTAEGGLETVEMEGATVIVDIENIQQGWLKLSGGRDWVEWPNNDPTKCPKPSDAHKQGFSVMFYSTKLFGDEPAREFCTSGTGSIEFIKKLYGEAESGFKKGQVPAIKMTGSTKVKIGKGNTRIPEFEIAKWVDRPDELGASAAPQAPAAAAASASASDDVDFDEI